jgi:hypothetical protein
VKYMLLIYGNQETWGSYSEEEMQQVIRDTHALQQELRDAGEWIGAYGVADQVNAKTIRVRDGMPAVTDGPYLEAKEYLGSFDIIDCDSLERALEIAARVPYAKLNAVEVRPLMQEAGTEM